MKYFLLIIGAFCNGVTFAQSLDSIGTEKHDQSVVEANLRRIKEAEDSLQTADEHKRFDLRLELFGRYLGTDPGKALIYLDKCSKMATEAGDSLWMVKSFNARGTFLKNRGEVREAIDLYKSALQVASRNKFRGQTIYLLNNLALSYNSISYFDQALRYHFESLKMRKEYGTPLDISITLNNIGTVYEELGDYENALEFYEESYRLKIENSVSHDIERSLLNIGRALIYLQKFDLAESQIRKILGICEDSRCRGDILLEAYEAFGQVLIQKRDYNQAEEYFNKSLVLSTNLKLSEYSASNYYWLANLKFLAGEHGAALKYLQLSSEMASKSGFQVLMLKNYLLFSEIFKIRQDYANAFEFQKKYNVLNAEIINGNLIRKMSRIETEFAERENKAKIESQENIMLLQKNSIRQQKLLLFALGWVVIVTLLMAIMLYKFYRKNLDVNMILDAKVKERTYELEKSSENLWIVHEEQVIMMSRIGADLKSIKATLKGLLNGLGADNLDDGLGHFKRVEYEIQKIVEYIDRCANSGRIKEDLNNQ